MSVNLGQTAATTLRRRESDIADSVTDNIALLAWLKNKGKIKTVTGGRTFTVPIFFAENDTAKFYDGGMESFVIAPQEIIDVSEWDRCFQAGFVYFTEQERVSNRGEAQAIDLIEAKIENLKASLANQFSTAMFADGSTAKHIEGLQALVADDPTASATVGGIAQNTYTWWRNKYNTSTTASASNIEATMDGLWLSIVRGTDRPDLIVAGTDMFSYYKNALGANQRFTDWRTADTLNFEGLKYQSSTVLHDPGCSTKRMYMLDTNDIELLVDSGCKWAVGSHREIANAMYEVVPVKWSGALVVRRRESHGVIEGTS
jgi:hypothetical protein